ncbi:hypothetical protein M419DRAFT_8512 [Trichoderma reesei RUT C-30]|uniref:Uncharacterized protein n=1 Tax=Hypocrea jecorina (strain ATCC 56765 / BCRC 32924 / NRRL 11460 / Rut C-30) TaxID=1344414 RepID=A0A024SD78_HYPJR|nr:hypothetical protein M419DRAFT_8512 [Trichoderma reesei RUT C-30]
MTVLGRKRCLCLHPGPDRGDAPSTLEYKARSRRPYEQPRGAHGVAASPTIPVPSCMSAPDAAMIRFDPPLPNLPAQ